MFIYQEIVETFINLQVNSLFDKKLEWGNC